MEHKNIVAAVVVLVLIIVGMFVFAYLKKNEMNEAENIPPVANEDVDGPYANISRIDAKHFYEEPTHTIAGEILMPTPCDLLNWTTRIQESSPESVIVDFDIVNHSEMCTQVVTPQRFKVSFDASEGANIRATLEGRNVELNLVPALPGETPDDFELFIKG
jgi:hypothetical protein